MAIPDNLKLNLTFDDFKRFLGEKYKNLTCPVCDENAGIELMYNAWGHNPKLVATYHALVSAKDALNTKPVMADITGFAMPVLPVACKSCGYLQLFSVNTIARWIEAHPAARSADSGSGDGATNE